MIAARASLEGLQTPAYQRKDFTPYVPISQPIFGGPQLRRARFGER